MEINSGVSGREKKETDREKEGENEEEIGEGRERGKRRESEEGQRAPLRNPRGFVENGRAVLDTSFGLAMGARNRTAFEERKLTIIAKSRFRNQSLWTSSLLLLLLH